MRRGELKGRHTRSDALGTPFQVGVFIAHVTQCMEHLLWSLRQTFVRCIRTQSGQIPWAGSIHYIPAVIISQHSVYPSIHDISAFIISHLMECPLRWLTGPAGHAPPRPSGGGPRRRGPWGCRLTLCGGNSRLVCSSPSPGHRPTH